MLSGSLVTFQDFTSEWRLNGNFSWTHDQPVLLLLQVKPEIILTSYACPSDWDNVACLRKTGWKMACI
jgi:hypothetical protein